MIFIMKLFQNEIKYVECEKEREIENKLENFDEESFNTKNV